MKKIQAFWWRGAKGIGVLLLVCALFLGVLRAQVAMTHRAVRKELEIWNADLASSISNSQWLTVRKILHTTSLNGLESASVVRDSQIVFSYPSGFAKDECYWAQELPIEHYGVPVGFIRACLSYSKHLQDALASPLFWGGGLIFFGLAYIFAAATLSSYREKLSLALESMRLWAEEPESFLERRSLGEGAKDHIQRQVVELIRTGALLIIDARTSREKLKIAEATAAIAQQVAHDIKSPIAALKSASESGFGLSKETKELIVHAVGRISEISADLLRGGKIAGPVSFGESRVGNLVPIDDILVPLVAEKRVELEARYPGVRLELDMSDPAILVRFPKGELQRILSNLINNAAEAYEGLAPSVQIVCGSLPGNLVLLSVRDSAKGIPPEFLEKLGKLRGYSVDKANGQGLGLFHARTTVESLGGSIMIESEVGKGTNVSIILPRALES